MPLFILMAKLGWTGSVWAVIVPWIVTAFGVFFMRQYLVDAVPDELIEAARVDGCSQIRIFLTVAVPAARPADGDPVALHVHAGLDRLLLAAHRAARRTTRPSRSPSTSCRAATTRTTAWSSPGATLATIPLLILFAATGRQFVSGIMQGAVKG